MLQVARVNLMIVVIFGTFRSSKCISVQTVPDVFWMLCKEISFTNYAQIK